MRSILIAFALVLLASDAAAIVGMPLTPMSYAGVARRTVRRTSYAAAATGAAAATTLPAGCAVGVPCGGVTYRAAYQGTEVVYVH